MNTSEPKARSRIAAQPKPISPSTTVTESRKPRLRNAQNFTFSLGSMAMPKFRQPFTAGSQYLQSLPFLIISLILYSLLSYIFITVSPQDVANWLFYQSFLPVIVLFFFATVFFVRFILQKKYLAWSISFWLTLLLFLKLQSFQLPLPFVVISCLFIVGPTLIWPVLFKK